VTSTCTTGVLTDACTAGTVTLGVVEATALGTVGAGTGLTGELTGVGAVASAEPETGGGATAPGGVTAEVLSEDVV
jgi:hypothetical protein